MLQLEVSKNSVIERNHLIQEAIASVNGTSNTMGHCQVCFHNLRICCKADDLEDNVSDADPEDDPCANWEANATGEESDAYVAIVE